MLLLPIFLYIAREVPYLIPPSSLAKLQTLFKKFILSGSRPRIKKKNLFQHIKHGGLSVPGLASYNIAEILEPSYVLWHHSSFYRWAQIENETLPYGSVKDLLAISPFYDKPPNSKLLTLSHFFYGMVQIRNLQKVGFCVQGRDSCYLPTDLDSSPAPI